MSWKFVCPWIFILIVLFFFMVASRDFHLVHADLGIRVASWVAVEPKAKEQVIGYITKGTLGKAEWDRYLGVIISDRIAFVGCYKPQDTWIPMLFAQIKHCCCFSSECYLFNWNVVK
ncbi:MAG: hypothetical protein QXJ69_03765 [Desulfurococcaceae archaeon]